MDDNSANDQICYRGFTKSSYKTVASYRSWPHFWGISFLGESQFLAAQSSLVYYLIFLGHILHELSKKPSVEVLFFFHTWKRLYGIDSWACTKLRLETMFLWVLKTVLPYHNTQGCKFEEPEAILLLNSSVS